jgi:aryl-alcohol dehydrogenase-like predicted oxidoreductase
MGILTGKFNGGTTFKQDDFRSKAAWHPGFKDGKPTKEWLDSLDSIRGILTEGGRTLAQGAIAWLWAKSPNTIPIPGFRDARQAEENALAMEKGPLSARQMADIDAVLRR